MSHGSSYAHAGKIAQQNGLFSLKILKFYPHNKKGPADMAGPSHSTE